ncbi:hypothetical protein MINS_41110 [Mycolicibacterium insubricum]|uniref:Uncharacterized protein n=1 Tax=Mycolicibacterium insubricum TaxID=444597 RepID=A0A1X0CTY1_9MYCO|nr:hypothetical protein [Mycolicibacterium insubricum]MCB0927251.1 hypothetical protein [Mycobacterium sp.]MCB9438729.1 hypothetical protein [Mycolicibacterium sp.]ORA63661.1 hypothetical protein BST26_20310 [Mycolicibacterium insubricum]BBZ68682.1 hypothetical protein MINS_41110 [Mycolicibacterium insubricum]
MEYVVTGASVFVLWGISAAVAGLIANDRERNPWAFAAITFFFLGPLGVGLAILAPHGAVERARLISARATLAGVAKRKAARAAAEAAESAEPETAGSDAPADGVQSAAAVEEPVVEVVEAVEVAEAAAEPVAEVEVAAVEVAAVEPEPVVVQPEAAEPEAAVEPEPKAAVESEPNAVEDKPAASPKPAAKPAAEAKRELRTIACPKCKTKNAVPIDARRMRCRKCREISAVAA